MHLLSLLFNCTQLQQWGLVCKCFSANGETVYLMLMLLSCSSNCLADLLIFILSLPMLWLIKLFILKLGLKKSQTSYDCILSYEKMNKEFRALKNWSLHWPVILCMMKKKEMNILCVRKHVARKMVFSYLESWCYFTLGERWMCKREQSM